MRRLVLSLSVLAVSVAYVMWSAAARPEGVAALLARLSLGFGQSPPVADDLLAPHGSLDGQSLGDAPPGGG